MKTLSIATTVLLMASSLALAQDKWFELKDFGPVTQRLAVTIENPADVPNECAVVHIPLKQLQAVLPDAKPRQITVVDPARKRKAPREAANLNFIPFQISAHSLIFDLPLKAHEQKQVYIYTAPQRLNMPGFPAKTAYDFRKAYHSFENPYIAYRIETGPGGNTTGMAIDSFGKTKAGEGLRLVEAYQHTTETYHKPSYWGMDILKVGDSPGIGGLYLISGDKMARPSFVTEMFDCLYTGPVETKMRVVGPVELNGKKYTITRYLTVVAGERTIHDNVQITGDDLTGIQLGVGIRNFDNETWTEKPEAGYAMVAGDANQSGYKSVAIGVTFAPSEFAKMIPLNNEESGGHIYVLNPKIENNKLVSAEHRLTMIWDQDGQINNPADFQKALERWSIQRDNPIKITLADHSESRP